MVMRPVAGGCAPSGRRFGPLSVPLDEYEVSSAASAALFLMKGLFVWAKRLRRLA